MCEICYGYGLRSDNFDGICPKCGRKICPDCNGFGTIKLPRIYRQVTTKRAVKLRKQGKEINWYWIYIWLDI